LSTVIVLVRWGKEIDHPSSLAHALNFSAWLYQARKEPQAVQRCIETVITLLGEEGSSYRLAQATILRGWAQVEQGRVTEGVVLLQQGLSTWKATGAEALLPCYLALLAEAYHKAGNTVAGLGALTSAMEHVNKTEERWYEAELYRLKGKLTLQQSQAPSLKSQVDNSQSAVCNPQPEAEAFFQKAIEIARRQQAKSLELRATVSLARLWQRQDKHHQARTVLADIYGWFTEGFDTKDLREAKALLEQLA